MIEVTDREITAYVREALGDDAPDFNVNAIVRELIATYDLIGDHPAMKYGDIPDSEFWAIIERHPRTEAGL